jgi:hypothetical protein
MGDCITREGYIAFSSPTQVLKLPQEGAKMPEVRMKVAPDTVAYADGENHKLIVEFAIPGAPAETIDLKILEDSVHLTAPARDIEACHRAILTRRPSTATTSANTPDQSPARSCRNRRALAYLR